MGVILIVDDEAIVREPLEAALSRAGHQPLTAASGADALARIGQHVPDLVLLDVAMPLMSGIETLRALRKNPATNHLPVIMLTKASDKGTIVAAARLGIDGYVLKPSFSLGAILEQIERALIPPASSPGRIANSGSSLAAPSFTTPSLPTTKDLSDGRHTSTAVRHETSVERLDDIQPLMTWSAVAAAIGQCAEPKGFSSAVSEVLKLTETSDCAIEQVAMAINHDHGMAIRILRLANSPVYRRGAAVDNMHTAVLRLGLGQIREAVMNMAVIDHFNSTAVGDLININQFWEHGVATGIIAAEIARSRDETQASTAFTLGVLHDIGRLALAEQLKDIYANVMAIARARRLPLEEVERHMLCCSHAELAERILRRWQFGKELIDPIVLHHSSARTIRDAATRDVPQAAGLAVANRLAHAFMLGSSGNETIYPTEDLCELLRIGPDVIGRIERCAREETDKVKVALLANAGAANCVQLRERYRQRLVVPLRPLFVSAQSALDACHIFCNQLANCSDDDTPNIAILHIRTSKESAKLCPRVSELEQQLRLTKLPLIVISPGGKIRAESFLEERRTVVNIALPFAIDRFIETVNSLMVQ